MAFEVAEITSLAALQSLMTSIATILTGTEDASGQISPDNITNLNTSLENVLAAMDDITVPAP